MFHLMTFHKSVKGKLTSALVSLSVLALTIVGAFAVNFSSANAFIGGSFSWVDFKEALLNQYPLELWSSGDFEYFENIIENHLDDHDYYISIAVGVNTDIGGFDYDYFAFSAFRTNSTGNYVWANDAQGKLITSGGTFNYYSEPAYFVCSPLSGGVRCVRGNFNNLHTSRFDNYVEWQYGSYFAVTNKTIAQTNCAVFTNQDVYTVGGSLIAGRNLTYGPRATYDNVIIKTGDRYYFTITDQYLIRMGAAGDDIISITFGSNSDPDWSDQYYNYCIDFTYLAIYAYPSITGISPNGILGWDITDIVNYTTADYVGFSKFRDLGDFGDNQAAITRDNVPDPWSTYYDYVNKLLEIADSPNHITSDNPPTYVSSNVYTSYKDLYVAGGSMSDAGNVILNELPSVPFDTILVCSDKLFNDLGNHVDLLSVSTSTNAFINYLSPYLLEQIDLIVVLPDDAFNNALQGQPDHSDNFVNWNPYSWNIGVASGQHGYFYYTSPTIRDVTANDVSGFAFCTQRYLDKCRNYMLSDGIRQLYEGLNAITDNQDSIITAIVNGAGSVYSSIQLCYGRLDNIYNLLNDINLSNKLQSIIDKLDRIADNTSEQTHDYWFISLYNWLLQFAPSNSDFATWVSDLTSFENQLPDPEATPAATVIPFPTVTAAAG